MPLPVTHNLFVYRGDTWSQVFRLTRDGAPENLAGATVESEARAPDGTLTDLVIVVEDVDEARIRLSLPPGFPPSSYQYDVEVTLASGDVTTWIKGSLMVMRDVTNSVVTP